MAGDKSDRPRPDFSNVKSGSSSRPVAPETPQDQWYTVSSGRQPLEDREAVLRRRQPLAEDLRGEPRSDQGSRPDPTRPEAQDSRGTEVALTRRKETLMRNFSAVVCVVIAFAALACERRSETAAPGAPGAGVQPPPVSAPTPLPARVTTIELGSAIGPDGRVAAGAGKDDVLPHRHDLRVDRDRQAAVGGIAQRALDVRGRPGRERRPRDAHVLGPHGLGVPHREARRLARGSLSRGDRAERSTRGRQEFEVR